MKKITELKILLFTVLVILVSSLSKAQNLDGNWAPNTKNEIDKIIYENKGVTNAYVVFDWDNTSIFGDVQDIVLFYQIEHLAFKLTPEQFKYSFLHYTDTGKDVNLEIPKKDFDKSFSNSDGKYVNINSIAEDCYNDYKYFYNNFREMNAGAEGNLSLNEIRETDQFKDFRAKIWFTYAALYKTFSPNVAYTWVMYISAAGFRIEEFSIIVENAIDWGIKRDSGINYFDSPESLPGKTGVIRNSKIGNYVLNTVRPVAEIISLFTELSKNKIQVFISTASLQNIVEVFATNPKYGYNLPKNHILGMRLKKDNDGKFLARYDNSENYTINSMTGKTININNILVKKYKSNPIIIGGDSDGDYSMMTELSGICKTKMINNYKPVSLLLVVNRLKGGKIGEICDVAIKQFGSPQNNKTIVVMQGRNENEGVWIASEKTIKINETTPRIK